MNVRNAGMLAAAALTLSAGSLLPAAAQTKRFAQFEVTDPNAQPFQYSGGGVGASITTVPSTFGTTLVFRSGAGALNNVQLDAATTFSATGGALSGNLNNIDFQDFTNAAFTFTSTAADVQYGLAIGTNLLTVNAFSPNAAITMTGVEGTTAPSLGASSANPNYVTAITFTSAVDALANGTKVGNAFNVAFNNANPGFSVPAPNGALAFTATDAGNFTAPVPELGSMVAFGGMVLGGGLLGFRRRFRA